MNPDQTVSVIIPARNEEQTIRLAVLSLACQPEICEIVVVDDQSTDDTARVLEALAAEVPQFRALEAGPLPEGWVGKNHAAWQGAQRATGDWLLFTDADALHLKGSTDRALLQAAVAGAEMLSISPSQVMGTWWERAIIPFVYCRLAQLYSYAAVNDPRSPAAAANGQYLLIRRDAYEAIGGHAAVRGDVLEDVALARLAKDAGVRLFFAPDEGFVRVRMYSTFRAMWEGWTKNLCPLVTGVGRSVTRELLYVLPWIPLLCLALTPRSTDCRPAGSAAAGRPPRRLCRRPAPESFPALQRRILYAGRAALLCSPGRFGLALRPRPGRWKGREYPVSRPGKQDSQGPA